MPKSKFRSSSKDRTLRRKRFKIDDTSLWFARVLSTLTSVHWGKYWIQKSYIRTQNVIWIFETHFCKKYSMNRGAFWKCELGLVQYLVDPFKIIQKLQNNIAWYGNPLIYDTITLMNIPLKHHIYIQNNEFSNKTYLLSELF